ncbi:MAG: Type restriction enzyme EcoKI specificity protein, partial [Planctomycetota bacterium]
MSAKTTIQETFDLSTLPPIPKSWKWCVPADCCSVIASGSTPKPDLMYSETGDVPFIKVYNLTHRGVLDFSVKPTFIDLATHIGPMSRSRAMPNDVLINIVGPPLGKVAIVPDDHPQWNINQAVVLFRPLDGVLSKYLAYAFLTDSIMKRVTSLAKATAGQSNIGVSMCRRLLPLPIAPTNEQHRIVAKIEELFSDLDAGVAALKRAKANLKRYRAAVLKAAVEGKLTEEWRAKHPAKESASTLLARILQERRQKWEADQLAKFAAAGKEPPKNWREKYVEPTRPDTAGLPELPKGWCWASVEQLAFVDVGFAFKSAEYTKKGIRLLRGENMEPGSLRWNDVRFWPEDKLAGLEHLLVEEGQIILAMDRPMVSAGLKLARVKANDIPCLLVQRMARLRMLDDTMTGFL